MLEEGPTLFFRTYILSNILQIDYNCVYGVNSVFAFSRSEQLFKKGGVKLRGKLILCLFEAQEKIFQKFYLPTIFFGMKGREGRKERDCSSYASQNQFHHPLLVLYDDPTQSPQCWLCGLTTLQFHHQFPSVNNKTCNKTCNKMFVSNKSTSFERISARSSLNQETQLLFFAQPNFFFFFR